MERPASWQLLGRSNPAGRALYKLFCTDVLGRGQGNCFSDRNRALAELRAVRLALTPSTTAARPASVCSKRATQNARPTVCTPKFPSRACRKVGAAPPRGRRPAHAILAAAKVEGVRALAAQPPTPVRVVGEAEKERLAALMQFGRQPPDSAQWGDLGHGRARTHGLQRGLQGELLVLLEQVLPMKGTLALCCWLTGSTGRCIHTVNDI